MILMRLAPWLPGLALTVVLLEVAASGHGATYGTDRPWLLVLEAVAGLALLVLAGLVVSTRAVVPAALVAAGWVVPELAGWPGLSTELRTLADVWSRLLPGLAVAAYAGLVLSDKARQPRRLLVLIAVTGGVLASLARLVLVDPYLRIDCWRTCDHNPWVVAQGAGVTRLGLVGEGIGAVAIATATVVLMLSVGRDLVGRGTPVAIGSAALLLAVATPGVLRIGIAEAPSHPAYLTAFLAAQVAPIAAAAWASHDLVHRWRLRIRLTRLATSISATPTRGQVERALQHALRSDQVEVCYWSPTREGYLDADGGPRASPSADPGWQLTMVTRDGASVATIRHPRTIDGQQLVAVLGPALRLALQNEQLRAASLAELRELQDSRRRIVERAGLERRRLERNLHDGAQQRVVSLALLLRIVAGQPGSPEFAALSRRAADETTSMVESLRRLARGIHPTLVADSGLNGALRELAASSTDLAVQVEANGSDDYPALVSTMAFRVVEAAMTDARSRHAVRVTVRSRGGDGTLMVEILDDGPAGPGTALAGLEPQVAALSGEIRVERRNGGSRVRMALPCAS